VVAAWTTPRFMGNSLFTNEYVERIALINFVLKLNANPFSQIRFTYFQLLYPFVVGSVVFRFRNELLSFAEQDLILIRRGRGIVFFLRHWGPRLPNP
jgi:hypothetical protein